MKRDVHGVLEFNPAGKATDVPPTSAEGPAGIDGGRRLWPEATKVGEEEVAQVIRNSDRIRQKIHDAGPLRGFLNDGTTFLSMVRDYANGSYRNIPFGSVVAIATALLYVLNPFDLVPDAIPGVGLIDDATVVGACLRLVTTDLGKYRTWRETQPGG